jgi:flagellar motor switch protein FliG
MIPGKTTASLSELDGATKVAILLLTLDRDAAAAILREMPPSEVEELTGILARLEDVPRNIARAVVREFEALRLGNRSLTEGGIDYAAQLVREAVEPNVAQSIIDGIHDQIDSPPFEFLRRVDTESLRSVLCDEHPQAITLVVSHLPPRQAAEVLAGLSPQKQSDVVRRVAELKHADPQVLREVEAGLKARLAGEGARRTVESGGVGTVARVLNRCDRPTEQAILGAIEGDDPDLVGEIRRSMFVFEDLCRVDDRGLQSVLREIENEELCLALKTASDELKDKIFKNLSARAVEVIREDMQYMGPVRLGDVESAQQRIIDVVRRLEEAEALYVSGRGGREDLLV